MKKTRRLLGTVERAQAIINQTFPFNVVAVLRIANGPKPEKLKKAVNELCHRHPILGACIKIEKNQFFFQLEHLKEIPLNLISRKKETTWQKVAEKELNSPTDFLNGPLIRIYYITDPKISYESEIILTFHHAAMDGASGGKLLDELLMLCCGKELNPSPDMKTPMALHPPAQVFFPLPYKGIRGKFNNFVYLLRMIGDEFIYRAKTTNSRKAPIHKVGCGKIITFSFSKELSTLLWKQARKTRITINNLFDAALLKSVHKHLYNDAATAMRFFTFADLRPFLIPPIPADITGSYFSMMRFTATLKPKIQLTDLARQIQNKVYTSLKRGDKFCAHLQTADIMKVMLQFKSFRMGTTALSHMGQVNLNPSYENIKVHEVHVFTSNFVLGPEYTAQTRFFNNQFHWDILYLDTDMDEILARDIADDITQILEFFARGGGINESNLK